MDKITLVQELTGDWMGLYKNGELVIENHSLTEGEILRALGIPFEMYYDVDLEPYRNHLPQKLYDLDLINALGNGVA